MRSFVPREIEIRRLVETAFFLTLLAAVARLLSDGTALGAAFRVIFPLTTFCFVPGFVLLLAVGGPRRSLLDVLAFSIALTPPIVQLLTIGTIILGLPASTAAWSLWGFCLIGTAALRATVKRDDRLVCEGSEWCILGSLVPFALLLYVKGTPFFADEYQTHVAVVRRLAFVPQTNTADIFPLAGIPFTHPFPSIHMLMAMSSCLGDIDALFLFHKARFLWGPAALIVLYAFAHRVFEDGRLATASFWGALCLTLTGAFADYPTLFWGQLAEFSHPSGIALTLYLPATLFLFVAFLDARGKREIGSGYLFLLLATSTLAVSHIREAVQFVIYTVAFGTAMSVLPLRRGAALRSFAAAAGTMVVCKAYTVVHAHLVPHVSPYNDAAKELLRAQFQRTGWWELFAEPLHPYWAVSLYFGLFAILLLTTPFVVARDRGNAKLWFIGSSILAYMLLIRFPILSMAYTYLTFWEILSTSVRNVVFFLYVLAGPAIYLGAESLERRVGRRVALLAALPAAGCGYYAVPKLARAITFRPYWNQVFYAIVIGGLFAAAYAALRDARRRSRVSTSDVRLTSAWEKSGLFERKRTTYGLFACYLAALAIATFNGATSPFNVRAVTTTAPTAHAPIYVTPGDLATKSPVWISTDTPLASLNAALSKHEGVAFKAASEVPPAPLVRWATDNIRPDARLAVNTFSFYSPSTFLPFRTAALPLTQTSNFYYLADMMPEFLRQLDECVAEKRPQPFFNGDDSYEERREFLSKLDVTHVVVDPMLYSELKPKLQDLPQLLLPQYDDGRWAVYEVVETAAAPQPPTSRKTAVARSSTKSPAR